MIAIPLPIWIRSLRRFIFGFIFSSYAHADIGLKVPEETPAGGPFEVTWTDAKAKGRISVTGEDGTALKPPGSYGYTNPKLLKHSLTAPTLPGRYGVVFREQGKEQTGLVTFEVTPVTATLSAPVKGAIGESIPVKFTGPIYAQDRIAFASQDAGPMRGASYAYPGNSDNGLVTLRAPMEPGSYTIIYSMRDVTLARHEIQIGGAATSLEAADTVQAGGQLEVFWEGPDNNGDFVTLYDSSGKRCSGHAYTGNSQGYAVSLIVPELLGTYEVVYVSGGLVLARRAVEIVPVSATLDAKPEVIAGMDFEIDWTGPGNRQDRILVVPADAPDETAGYRYLDPSAPSVIMRAPADAGAYELRYQTSKGVVLANRPIQIIPAPQKPGILNVIAKPAATLTDGSAVEVILDASGSMLQRQGGKRRIEIARETLVSLVTETIPKNTPFALRVFGHKEANSCRTDLEIPLVPLDATSLTPIINEINAVNLAKTPIAASLAAVASDLKSVAGERVVILLTDGEETCEGDPALAIRSLCARGASVRVNIVGFAIEDESLKQTFESWATLGSGRYLNAPSGNELAQAMRQALALPYKIYQNNELIGSGVTGAGSHQLPAGAYEVRFKKADKVVTTSVTVIAEKAIELEIP